MPRRERCAVGATQGKGCTVRIVAIELSRVAVQILFRFVVIAVGTAVQADDHMAARLFQWRNMGHRPAAASPIIAQSVGNRQAAY